TVIPDGAIVLLRNVALVGDAGRVWNTDWVPFPAEVQGAQYAVEVRSIDAGKTANVDLFTAYDMDVAFPAAVAAPVTLSAVGLTVFNILSGMGRLVRVRITTNNNGTYMEVSAWLTP